MMTEISPSKPNLADTRLESSYQVTGVVITAGTVTTIIYYYNYYYGGDTSHLR